MSALETFTFNGYTLRPANESDLPLAQLWTLADTDHKDITLPSFWIEQRIGRDSYLLSDGAGPVFFFKLHVTTWRGSAMKPCRVELHIQFMPGITDEDTGRIRGGLTQGMTWLERVLRLSAIREVSFDSSNRKLIAFCKKRLGFSGEAGRLVKHISPVEA